MDQPINWFGGERFAGFSDDEIRTIQEGAALRARKGAAAARQAAWRAAAPRTRRSVKRKAA
jgi:hypothetical protein